MEVQHHEVEGLLLRSTVTGTGDRVAVLVHGLGCSSDTWAKNIEAIAGCARVHAVDLPGFGESDTPDEIMPADRLADMLAAWCREAGIARAAFIGHSLGGEVCLWLAIKHPHLVERMVLAASTGGDTETSLLQRLPQLLADGLREPLAFMPTLLRAYAQASPERIVATAAASLSPELRTLLGTIRVPVLVVWGRNDAVVPLREATALTAALRAARLFVIEDAAHGVIFGAPDRFNALVCDFLAA